MHLSPLEEAVTAGLAPGAEVGGTPPLGGAGRAPEMA